MQGRPTPGVTTPGPKTPGPNQPGTDTRDDPPIQTQTVTNNGIPIDSTGTTTVGTPTGYAGRVVSVTINPTQSDFEFNVNADGSAIFASAQTVDNTNEDTYYPDRELADFEADAPTLDFEVTTASSTGGATCDVDITVEIEEQMV